MRGLLIVLCALATIAAVLAGGCGGVASLIGVAAKDRDLLWIGLPVATAAAVVFAANVALANALHQKQAPGRDMRFLVLAVVDLVAAVGVLAIIAGSGMMVADATALALPLALAALLALKGVLTLFLPAASPPRSGADDRTAPPRDGT